MLTLLPRHPETKALFPLRGSFMRDQLVLHMERVEIKKVMFGSKVFEVLCPVSEMESAGGPWVFRCVCLL